jgi:hypothetical protein
MYYNVQSTETLASVALKHADCVYDAMPFAIRILDISIPAASIFPHGDSGQYSRDQDLGALFSWLHFWTMCMLD